MSLESVTVRRVNHRTGEVVEMVGEQEIMDGMAAVLEREQATGQNGRRQSFKERQRDRALRVVDAQKQVKAAQEHVKVCKAELELAWSDLREHALNEDAALSPRQGGLEDEDDEG